MEEHTFVWLPRNGWKTFRLKMIGSKFRQISVRSTERGLNLDTHSSFDDLRGNWKFSDRALRSRLWSLDQVKRLVLGPSGPGFTNLGCCGSPRELGRLLIMFKMEKHAQRQNSNMQFNRNVPGCFWSIFNAIDYHPWHNVKKMLPYKKHSRSKGGPKSTLNNNHVAEVPERINDVKPQLCTSESCPFNRRSGEARVSEVVTKEISEEESQKSWKSDSNSKPRLSRTHSIHHLESPCCSPRYNEEIGDSAVAPQQKTTMKLAASGLKSNSLNAMDTEDYFIQRKIAIRLTPFTEKCNGVKKTLETKQVNSNISSRSFKDDVHIQEIYKAHRKLFAELLQGARGKHTLKTSQNTKPSASLAKSRSFPAPGLARKGYKKLSSLQHKQNESFPKGKKSGSVPQPSKLVESESPKNFHEDTTPCDSASTSSHNIRQQTSSSSLGPNRGLKHRGWNQLVIKRFNFIKQKIRHSFKERKKGNNQKTPKGIPTADPSGHKLPLYREEAQESLGTATSEDASGIRGYSETKSSENDNLSNGVQTKKGTASLNASLERYSRLSEYGPNNQKTPKGIPTADPSGHKLPLYREEAQESLGTATSEDASGIRGYSETNSSENDNLSNVVQTKKGTASLNASLERYSQLSEYGSNKNREAKCYQPQSIRLAIEDKIPNREMPPKSFGRNLSMPDIDLFCTLFTDPPHGVFRTEKPKRGVVHYSTDNNIRTDENPAHLLNADISEPLDSDSQSMIEKGDDNMPVDYSGSLNGAKDEEGIAWADELEEEIPHLDISDSKHHQILGSECRVEYVSETIDDVTSHINQVLELETCFQDDEVLMLSNSEGATLHPGGSNANELEPFNDQPNEASTEALLSFETSVDHEIIDDDENISNYLYLLSDSDRINNADFNYMRYILQLSSFIESGHTIDRPLSPSIFDGEEAHFYKKLEFYWKKVDKDPDHQLLLDLVDETLHNVFDRSFTSLLKTFSWKSRIRPMPLGQYLLEEVQEKVAWYLCLGPELDQSLDDVMGRDLRKGDDWMNLQSETEHITLELEDWILDDLLDEVLSF